MTKKKKKKQGTRNRNKGHQAERDVARDFRSLGYKYAKTTRAASRLLDECKIDIAFGPEEHIQIKAGYAKRRPKYDVIYRQIHEKLDEHFPEDDEIHDKPVVLLHKINARKKENFIVSISYDYYLEIQKKLLKLKKLEEQIEEPDKKDN